MIDTTSPDSPDYLPNTLHECHKLIIELRKEIQELKKVAETVDELKKRIAALEVQIKGHNRARFGKSSAQVKTSSLKGAGKAFYDESINEFEQTEKFSDTTSNEKKHGGGGRTATKSDIDEDIQYHKIKDTDELKCPCCNTPREVIGFDTSFQIDAIKAILKRIKHIQYKYFCPKCKGKIVKAPKPESAIAKSYATEGLITYIGVSKFDWHLPLYRQEKIFRAHSVPIARSTMCRFLSAGADILEHIVKRMNQLILNSRVIQSDHTTMPMLKKGLGKTYDFTETQEGEHPVRMLPEFQGVLQTDGASYFNEVNRVRTENARRAGCLSHAFRYFEAAKDEDPERVGFALGLMKFLFKVEEESRGLSESDKLNIRQKYSKPRLKILLNWLIAHAQSPDILPESAFGKAINYCLKQWETLVLYADTGFVEAHNNNSENGLRSVVLGKNYAKYANMSV